MRYVAVFNKEKRGISVTFPDFPGCTTFGEDMDEAVDQAHEALALYIEFFLEENKTLPEPSEKKKIAASIDKNNAKVINVDVVGNGEDFEEVEVTLHTRLLGRIEKYCREHGVSPADFISVAARKALKDDVFAE